MSANSCFLRWALWCCPKSVGVWCALDSGLSVVDPAALETCPQCGEKALYQREDDCEETVRNRLGVYREKTYPAAATLGDKYKLARIEGTGTPDEVSQRIQSVLA